MDSQKENLFENPITMTFNILDSYRNIVDLNLANYISDKNQRKQILDSLEIDRGAYFSLNRPYKKSSEFTTNFFNNVGISPELGKKMPNIEHLFIHQEKAIRAILDGKNTVLSTGTGSGKTETFLIPLIDWCIKNREPGIKALIIYPMNALANDQLKRLAKYTRDLNVTYGIYVGTTPYFKSEVTNQGGEVIPNLLASRQEMIETPPDILITNYVMLDWLLTGQDTYTLFSRSEKSLRYIVLDELHTYRGNKATHLKYLLRRLKYFLKNEIIHIGTSATLMRSNHGNVIQEGYLHRDEEKIKVFITNLWDIGSDSYVFVEPEYEPIQTEEKIFIDITPEIEGGWKLQVDQETGINNINQLTQEKFKEWDLGEEVSSSRIFTRLERDYFIQKLKKELNSEPLSFTEITSLLSHVKTTYPEELAKAYLSAISFLNYMSHKPLLDFRIHLFIKNLDGYLKRCIKCGKYHTGKKDVCLDCGFPLFYVYRDNINKMIGKMSGSFLRNNLSPQEDDASAAYYVLFSRWNSSNENISATFDKEKAISNGKMILDYADYGKILLELIIHNDSLLMVKPKNYIIIEKNYLIPLGDPRKDYKYLEQLVKQVLLFHTDQSKRKILAFIDSREKASQYAAILQDEFIEEFFIEYLKFILPEESSLPILTILEFVQRDISRREENLSEFEKKVLNEFELWYWRYLSMLPRKFQNTVNSLSIEGYSQLSEIEKKVLDVFLDERIIAKPLTFDKERMGPRFIKFFLVYATEQRGISIKPDQIAPDPEFPSYLSIGEQAQIYPLLTDLELKGEELEEILENLCEQKILIKGYWNNGKIAFENKLKSQYFLYYLNPEKITLQMLPSAFTDYDEIRKKYLFRVAVHSSDVNPLDRKQIEDDFSNSEIHFLISTPTLEMGIDIGKLINVMMIGTPPLPSNYAQRAGRAGRESGNNYALIINICGLMINKLNHDEFYYNQPKQMIKGIISPPSFNPNNRDVIQKHINAFLYTWLIINKKITEPQQILELSLPEVGKVFNGEKPHNDNFYVNSINYFKREYYSKLSKDMTQSHFYESSFFPDYSFNRDMVHLIDYEKIKEKQKEDIRLDDMAIASYEYENAITKFIPGEQIFAAGEVYKVLPEGIYISRTESNNTEIREYQTFYAKKEIKYAKKEIIREYNVFKYCNATNSLQKEVRGILKIIYIPLANLTFTNRLQNETFQIGYSLDREALVFILDPIVSDDEVYQISFASALDRVIKDHYGLDESEVKVEMNMAVKQKGRTSEAGAQEESNEKAIVFYDGTGNGNIPFKKIYEDFEEVLNITYLNVKNCRNPECKNGCYLCVKTYQTQFFSELAQREIALMIFGYLAGDENIKFKPKIPNPPTKIAEYDMVIYYDTKKAKIKTSFNTHGYSLPDKITNEALFELLANIIQEEYKPETKSLRIVVNDESTLRRIKGENIKAGAEAFARYQFQLLRFKHYYINTVKEILNWRI